MVGIVVDVQLRRDLRALERPVKVQTVLYGHNRIFGRGKKERGRRRLGHRKIIRVSLFQSWVGIRAKKVHPRTRVCERKLHADYRIAQNHKVGPAIDAVDRVDGVLRLGLRQGTRNGRRAFAMRSKR